MNKATIAVMLLCIVLCGCIMAYHVVGWNTHGYNGPLQMFGAVVGVAAALAGIIFGVVTIHRMRIVREKR